jgi:hypothetical protein
MMDLDGVLLQLCRVTGADEGAVMSEVGLPDEDSYVGIPDEYDGAVFIARIGRAIAAMGVHLQLRAVFPDSEHTILIEPGPEHLEDWPEHLKNPPANGS